MADSMMFDALVASETIRRAVIDMTRSGALSLYTTHIQEDQLERIADLDKVWRVKSVPRRIIPTSEFIVGVSRLGMARLGTGRAYELVRNGQRHIDDAIIAATAVGPGFRPLSNASSEAEYEGHEPAMSLTAPHRERLRRAFISRVERVERLKTLRIATALCTSLALFGLWSQVGAIGQGVIDIIGTSSPVGVTDQPKPVGVGAIVVGSGLLYVLQVALFDLDNRRALKALFGDRDASPQDEVQPLGFIAGPMVLGVVALLVGADFGGVIPAVIGLIFVLFKGADQLIERRPELRMAAPLITEDVVVDADLLWRDGWDVRRVRVIDLDGAEGFKNRMRRAIAGSARITIEILDEPSGPRGTQNPVKGQRIVVYGVSSLPCTWPAYQAAATSLAG